MAGIRARSRPRIRSANFRRLRYVLVREAAFRIFFPTGAVSPQASHFKRVMLRAANQRIIDTAARVLALWPERRVWPPLCL